MSDDADRDTVPQTPQGSSPSDSPESGSALPRTLQEHLAQKLRSAYHELADKPAFLGDPAVPVEFEYHLQRLEAVEKVRHTEKVHTEAVEAVKAALENIAGPFDPDLPEDRKERDET
jgi:hypothetical protein